MTLKPFFIVMCLTLLCLTMCVTADFSVSDLTPNSSTIPMIRKKLLSLPLAAFSHLMISPNIRLVLVLALLIVNPPQSPLRLYNVKLIKLKLLQVQKALILVLSMKL